MQRAGADSQGLRDRAAAGVLRFTAGASLLAVATGASAQSLLTLNSSSGPAGTTWSVPIETLLVFSALSFLPAMLLLMTSFTRIVIVLSLVRQALGLQSSPPNQVIVGIALFLTLSEVVVELYARTEHANGLYYLMFGLHGLTNLVPWFWGAVILMISSFVLFLIPSIRNNFKLLPIPCVMAFAGIWIEKGMGLIVPGFIPTPIGEVTEYYPTFVEWLLTLGIWAFGFFILTILLKGAIGILQGEIKYVAAK